MDYVSLKNEYISGMGRGIHSRKEAQTARTRFDGLCKEAVRSFQNPTDEMRDLARWFFSAIDKGISEQERVSKEFFREREKISKETFVDRVSPELDATVNALALSLTNQLMTAKHKSPRQVQEIADRALSSREGAMALLRVPTDLVSDSVIDRAIEASKSFECRAFESARNEKLDALERGYGKACVEAFQMRRVREAVENRIAENPYFDMPALPFNTAQ
mgnify:CR=1 FL=1